MRLVLKLLKWAFVSIFLIMALSILAIWVCDKYVENKSLGKIYTSVEDIPHRKVGVVLGTSKYLRNNRINLYYQYRIDATVALYKAGKIDYVLISGDNGSQYYDEPTTFKEDLVRLGIPENKIYLDYAGFRTLDSIVRANKVFLLNDFTVISQNFHNQRALAIAGHYDLDVIAFNAQDVNKKYAIKVYVREYFARVKMCLDLLFNVGPKYLGPTISIQ